VRFQVLTTASMKVTAFCDMVSCSDDDSSSWWWMQHSPLKRQCTSTRLQGATSQILNQLTDQKLLTHTNLASTQFN
jgi:hypothetical protein